MVPCRLTSKESHPRLGLSFNRTSTMVRLCIRKMFQWKYLWHHLLISKKHKNNLLVTNHNTNINPSKTKRTPMENLSSNSINTQILISNMRYSSQIDNWLEKSMSTRYRCSNTNSSSNKMATNNMITKLSSTLFKIQLLSINNLQGISNSNSSIWVRSVRNYSSLLISRTLLTSQISTSHKEVRHRWRIDRAVTSMKLRLLTNTRISKTRIIRQRLKMISLFQSMTIQPSKRIIWMPWVTVHHLPKVANHIFSPLKTPALWSCTMQLFVTMVQMLRQILQRQMQTTLISYRPRAIKSCLTLRLLIECQANCIKLTHRQELPQALFRVITIWLLWTISPSVWRTPQFQPVQTVRLRRNNTSTYNIAAVQTVRQELSNRLALEDILSSSR